MHHPSDHDLQILPFPAASTQTEAILDALPSDTITRWTPSAKKAVLDAIRVGAISIIDACRRFNLSADELDAWDKRERMYGRKGLMSTRISRYRRASHHKNGESSVELPVPDGVLPSRMLK